LALEQFFPGGLASASRVLPWLQTASRPDLPMCAYAALVDDPNPPADAPSAERGRIRSGFVLHPDSNDIARLGNELRTLARDALGAAAGGVLDSVRASTVTNDRIELNIFAGTASRSGCRIALSDGEFAVASSFAMKQAALSREEWCDVLWPDRDPESAARLLKVYVHRIRSKFGDDRVIETHGRGYRIGRDVRVDVHSLEALARKRNAGTERLESTQLHNLQRAFDGFKARRYLRLACLEQYEELERRIIATGVELARILFHDALFREDGACALSIAEHLVAIDPYDEVAAELLIRAQLWLGRRDAASRYFRTYCHTLREELALPPPQHLARLVTGE
jgi:DNA-binding SARP family transcriptional activator